MRLDNVYFCSIISKIKVEGEPDRYRVADKDEEADKVAVGSAIRVEDDGENTKNKIDVCSPG